MKHLITLAFAALMSFQVMAADLKDKDVSTWLANMPTLEPWLKKHENDISSNISDPSNPDIVFKESVGALKKAGIYDELNGKVKKLGYKDVEQWTGITQQVTFAWMALKMEENKAQIDAAIAQLKAMKSNPNIPPAQKAAMEKMMAPGLAIAKLASKSSIADREAVKPYQKKLRTYFDGKKK